MSCPSKFRILRSGYLQQALLPALRHPLLMDSPSESELSLLSERSMGTLCHAHQVVPEGTRKCGEADTGEVWEERLG